MYINVERSDKNNNRTIGSMYIDDEWVCYTEEPPVRTGPKVLGHTAIPAGTYRVIITHSPHFNKDLPLLVNVPDFEGVRIHSGNTVADTEGCILVGLNRTTDTVTESRLAFSKVFAKIKNAIDSGDEVQISIGG